MNEIYSRWNLLSEHMGLAQWNDKLNQYTAICIISLKHYCDVIMGAIASQITSSFTVVYSTVYLGADQRKHKSSVSLAFFTWFTLSVYTLQPLRTPGHCRRPSGRVGCRQTSPVNTLTPANFHRSFWNFGRTFIAVRSRKISIMGVIQWAGLFWHSWTHFWS